MESKSLFSKKALVLLGLMFVGSMADTVGTIGEETGVTTITTEPVVTTPI